MKRLFFTLIVIFLSLASFAALPVIDPELEADMQRLGNDEKTKVVILLSEQSDAMALLREAEFFSSRLKYLYLQDPILIFPIFRFFFVPVKHLYG